MTTTHILVEYQGKHHTIALVNAKTCHGCRALMSAQGEAMRCGTKGYECKNGIPLKPCPKPKTHEAWLIAGYAPGQHPRRPCLQVYPEIPSTNKGSQA